MAFPRITRPLSGDVLPPPRDATKGPRTRQGLARLAREGLQLCRADHEAGKRASALRWLALARSLRVAAALTGGAA